MWFTPHPPTKVQAYQIQLNFPGENHQQNSPLKTCLEPHGNPSMYVLVVVSIGWLQVFTSEMVGIHEIFIHEKNLVVSGTSCIPPFIYVQFSKFFREMLWTKIIHETLMLSKKPFRETPTLPGRTNSLSLKHLKTNMTLEHLHFQ